MTVQLAEAPASIPPATPAPALDTEQDWTLDITLVESGPEADRLIRMTDDGCGKTCQSACPNTCP
ncbi:FxLD family lanthipeptide [Nonomuraea sp. NPDC049480]|uniref:FxLD family lanthipeptide n=1 Tax=Nonomuraea sp. NPDC049480 TaxID=3364353 RepID=UPI0037A40AB5